MPKRCQHKIFRKNVLVFFEDGFVLTAMSADFAGGLVVVADHDSLSVSIVYEKLMTVFLGQAGSPPYV